MPKRMLTEEALFESIDIWATDFRAALMDRKTYPSHHFQFHDDARILKRQLLVFAHSGRTIFDFVNDIFLDSGKRGYVDTLHFPALITGFKSWASEDDLPAWQPPADMPLPSLPPVRKPQKKGRAIEYLERTMQVAEEEEQTEVVVVKPSAGKGKEKEREKEQEKEQGVKRKRPEVVSRPAGPLKEGTSSGMSGRVVKLTSMVPSDADDEDDIDLEELNDPPCKRCAKNKIPCVVQPDPKKSGVKDKRIRNRLVCVACRETKNKCELAAKKVRSPTPETVSAPLHPDQDTKDTPAPPKAKRAPKKKVQVVPPGGPGEYTSQLLPYFYIEVSNTSLGLHPIPAGLQEKLEAYEQRTNELEEQLGDLAAKFVRLESENQSMRAWYTGRIISVWEGLQQLGERMTRSMNSMVQVVGEDTTKHKRLAELMEETHLCLGIPYTPYHGPLPPAPTLLPPADIQPPAVSSTIQPSPHEGMEVFTAAPVDGPSQEVPTSIGLTDSLMDEAEDLAGLPSPRPHTPKKDTTQAEQASLPLPLPMSFTPRFMKAGVHSKRALSAVPEDAEDGDRPKKQRVV